MPPFEAAERLTVPDRGCVKTRAMRSWQKIDLSDRSVFDDRHSRRGEKTPENEMAVRFYTASTLSGHSGIAKQTPDISS